MAGKIALGLIVAILIGVTCFAAGWRHREDLSIECRVIRVVTEETPNYPNAHGLQVPYTIAGRGFEIETHVLPGVVGQVGDTVTIHR